MTQQPPSNDGGVSESIHNFNATSAVANGDANEWMQFFGPANGPVNSQPYDKYRYTTYDLPEAYIGKNYYLRDTIEGLISGDSSQHTWYTSPACLPYQQTDQIHLAWNVWQFNRTLAGQVPHQGISRLITSSKRSFKDHTVRHGLAFYLEHGFMKTAEGRQQYQRNLLGIRQCVQETNNYDVLSTLLHSDRYDREYQLKHGDYSRPTAEVMRREVSEWASVQKSGYGLEWLIEEYKEHLQRNGGVVPSSFVIPPRMALHMTMNDPVKTQYMYAGESGVKMLKDGPSALTTFRGVSVFKTHSFDVYEGELPIDLLSRDMQIGEFYTMKDTVSTHTGEKYNSSMRDVIIYDEVLDDWKRITLAEAIENCARFEEDGSLVEDIRRDDTFTIDSHPGDNVEVYGQVRRKFLSASELDKVGESADYESYDKIHGRALIEGLQQVETWASLADEPSALSFGIAKGMGASGPTGLQEYSTGEHLFSHPSTLDASSIPANKAGCCNWVMLRLIQKHDSTPLKRTISKFMDAVEALYTLVQKAFPQSHVLNHKEYGSEFLTVFCASEREKNLCTFFENCVGRHYQPLWSNSVGQSTQPLPDIIDATVDGVSVLSALQTDFSLNEAQVKRVINYVYNKGKTNSGNIDLNEKVKTKAQAKALAEKFKTLQDKALLEDEPAQFQEDYITPLSCTPALGMKTLANGYLYPNPLSGGYTHLGNTRKQEYIDVSIQSKAPSTLESMGAMQRHMTSCTPISSKRRVASGGFGSEERKKHKQNLAIDNYMENILGESEAHIGAKYQRRDATGVFDRIVKGGSLHVHVEHAQKSPSHVQRAVMVTFLFTPVNRDSLLSMNRAHVYVPFSVLLARPYMTYSMSSAILLKGGYDTGACYVGHSDFQLGDDVASKVHYGNFTYYSKSIVHEPKNVIVLENVMANRYLYGDGTKFWKPEDLITEIDADTPGVKDKGLISMILPAGNRLVESNPISLTGSFARDNVPNSHRHFEGAEWYAAKWNFKDSTDVDDNELIRYDQTHREANTVCFRGHQFSYSQISGGFSSVTRNSGHFGEDVYPGCGKVRSGAGKVFEKQSYASSPN